MNAPQPNTGNSMSCLFSRRSDFWQLRDHILTAGARRQFLGKHGNLFPECFIKIASHMRRAAF